MLAVSATFYDDFTSADPAGQKGASWANGNTEKGVLVISIDGTTGDDDVYMRVSGGKYWFATDPLFSSTSLLSISTYGYAPPSDMLNPANAPANAAVTIGTSILSTYTHSYTLQTVDPDITPTTPVEGKTSSAFKSAFDTILVRVDASSLPASPSFTIVGASQNVDKTLIVDLSDGTSSLDDSAIRIGSPVLVAASTADGSLNGTISPAATPASGITAPTTRVGSIYLRAEAITIDAKVSSQNDLVLMSEDGLAGGVADGGAGIAINQAVAVPGLVTASVMGTAFNVNAGGSIGNGTAASTGLIMDLQDADARVVGTINAKDQSYFIMASALAPAATTSRTITTRSASTGTQTGTITADQMLVYLANDVQAAGSDGSVDLQTAVGNLRITSAPGATLDYDITIKNKTTSLLLDAVSASEGDIAISNTGAIDLQAAIDTVGAFALSTAVNFNVASAVKSASGIVLTSTGGTLTTSAAIEAAASAGPGTITLSGAKDVTVNSLVSSPTSVKIISTGGAIKSGANLALDPTSRATSPGLFLSAATGIDLGTDAANVDAIVTGTGTLAISDAGAWGGLVVERAATASGDVKITSSQSIDLQAVVAGGNGNATVTSTGGDIFVDSVIADGNVVTLTAAEFDTDGTTPLSWRFISGNAPTAAEINWTAADVVDGDALTDTQLYRNVPVISAYRLSDGDITFTADNAVTLKSIKTTNGSVAVTSTGGSIVATGITAVSFGAPADVSLTAQGGGVTLGAVVADGTVTVTAAQGIADDASFATTGITADVISLSAAAGGVASDIGTAANRISVAARTAGGAVALTIAQDAAAGALDAQSVYVTSAASVDLNAAAVDLVDVQTTGVQSDLDAQNVTASDTDGQIVLAAGRDLVAGTLKVGGAAFGTASSISLQAGRGITIDAGSSMQAETLSLSAAQFPGQADLTGVDDVNHFVVAATSASSLDLQFDRPNDLILDKVTTANGNIAITNAGAGAILVGSGGITAGTTTTNNSVTISSQSDIAGYAAPAATGAGAFGAFSMAAQAPTAMAPAAPAATMTSGWERVAPLGRLGTSTSIVSWQGTAAAAFTDRWVVKASDPAVTSQSLLAGFKSRSATSTWSATSLGEGYFSVVAPKATQTSVLSWASATQGISFAQPDFVITTAAVPNDPSYGQLWGLNNTTTPAADIDAPAAWDITTGSRSTVVAVIDSGVDYNHPDLAANMWKNPGEIPGDKIDNDGNGFVDDVYGWDFVNNDADPMDDNDHGTHCSGTIGAVGNNTVGVVGVNWQVSIMALKAFSASGTGSTSAEISCVNYATMMRRDHGVNIVATNNSWGGGGYDQTLKDAIDAGGQAGILFIAAAGNSSTDNDTTPHYPSSYTSDAIIAVAATDSSNKLASFSCYGATSVDIGAPGAGILSTTPNNTYSTFSGTSMATPHVTGIVALLASAYPNATASQIKAAILSSAVPIPALAGKVATGGLANAPAALAALGAIAGSGTIKAGGLVTLTAVGDITANTSAGQLAATSGGALDVTQSGDVKIAGITAATSATLDVAGSVVTASGKFLTSPLATVTATGSISLATDVTTLSAVSSGGNVTVVEAN
ncbi:MAG: S8 family peptidase, partial [Planctomycetia bacterium]